MLSNNTQIDVQNNIVDIENTISFICKTEQTHTRNVTTEMLKKTIKRTNQ